MTKKTVITSLFMNKVCVFILFFLFVFAGWCLSKNIDNALFRFLMFGPFFVSELLQWGAISSSNGLYTKMRTYFFIYKITFIFAMFVAMLDGFLLANAMLTDSDTFAILVNFIVIFSYLVFLTTLDFIIDMLNFYSNVKMPSKED